MKIECLRLYEIISCCHMLCVDVFEYGVHESWAAISIGYYKIVYVDLHDSWKLVCPNKKLGYNAGTQHVFSEENDVLSTHVSYAYCITRLNWIVERWYAATMSDVTIFVKSECKSL